MPLYEEVRNLKEHIKTGFGIIVGLTLGMMASDVLLGAYSKLTKKECPKTEKKPESSDSQD